MTFGRRQTQGSAPRRALAALTAAGAVALLAAAAGAEPAFAGGCANANAGDDASARALRNAVACLINKDRGQRDRHRLDANGKLREAARKHTDVMLEENCWAHDCPGEPGLNKRVRKTGYLDGASKWRLAQNFGCADTPKGMVDAWLGKDFTRENIRNPAYRDIGVAIAKDQVPSSGCDDGDEVTFTVVFGRRRG
jgi:uncharacterized protein YkwD